MPVNLTDLAGRLIALRQDSLRAIALYADRGVRYEKVVEILDIAAKNNLKMVLATKAPQGGNSVEKENINESATHTPVSNFD